MNTTTILNMFPPKISVYEIVGGDNKTFIELLIRYASLQQYTKGYIRWDGFPLSDCDDVPKPKYIGVEEDTVIESSLLENLAYVGVGTYNFYESLLSEYKVSNTLSLEDQEKELVMKMGGDKNSSLESVIENIQKLDSDGNPSSICVSCATWMKNKSSVNVVTDKNELMVQHNNAIPPAIPLRGQLLD